MVQKAVLECREIFQLHILYFVPKCELGAVHKRRLHFPRFFYPLPPPHPSHSVVLMTTALEKDVQNPFTPPP